MPGSKNWKMETEKSNKTSSFTECDIRKIKVNLWQWTCNLHLYEYKKNYGTWIMRTGISRDKKCFQVFQQRKCFFYKFSLLPHIVNIKKPQTDKVMLFLWKSSPHSICYSHRSFHGRNLHLEDWCIDAHRWSLVKHGIVSSLCSVPPSFSIALLPLPQLAPTVQTHSYTLSASFKHSIRHQQILLLNTAPNPFGLPS